MLFCAEEEMLTFMTQSFFPSRDNSMAIDHIIIYCLNLLSISIMLHTQDDMY